LSDQLTSWLDTEWLPLPEHASIGQLVAELVGRSLSAAAAGAGGEFMEGEPLPAAAAADGSGAGGDGGGGGVDLTDLVLTVAGGLEGSPLLADIYVGPFDIGNRVAEEVLAWMGREGCCAGAEDHVVAAFREKHHAWDDEGEPLHGSSGITSGGDGGGDGDGSVAGGGGGGGGDVGHSGTTVAGGNDAATAAAPSAPTPTSEAAAAVPEAGRPPSLATRFDRWAWLGRFLDGEVPDAAANAVVLTVLGFEWDAIDQRWTGERVVARAKWLDGRDGVPDFLGSAADAAALAAGLPTEPEKVTALAEFVELVHGEEAVTRERAAPGPEGEAWRRKEIVAQWLHMFGGF